MSKPNPVILAAILCAALFALGVPVLAKGGLFINKYEGDTLHLMQIVFRMAQGQVPHLDFMTPIGAFAFAPLAWFVQAGMGIGAALLWSQFVFAAVMLPVVWWTGVSRMSATVAALFGVGVMVLMLALLHGGPEQSVAVSMHYNRWAWAVSFVAIALALLPPIHRQSIALDGIVTGVMMALLVMIKVTYFAAFAPAVILALVLRKQLRVLGLALVIGLGIIAIITVFFGLDFWFAYLRDLLTVSSSEIRSQPGADLGGVIGSPANIIGSLSAIFAVIFLRQGGRNTAGLVLLVLLPGFFYVTFQNFGNDPKWLFLMAVLLLTMLPDEGVKNDRDWDMRNATHLMAVIALVLSGASFMNLAYSPFRMLGVDVADYTPILANDPVHGDLQTAKLRGLRIDTNRPFEEIVPSMASYVDPEQRSPTAEFKGEVLANCEVDTGLPTWFQAIADDLDAAGYAGDRVFVADLFAAQWIFGGLEPMIGGAPWYYGGLPGLASAQHVLVPLCPVHLPTRALVLNSLTEFGVDDLTETRRTDLYILYLKG